MYENIYIYFDTNAIETRVGKKLFGDLVDIDVQFSLAEDENAYDGFVKNLEREMLEDSKFLAEIIPFPRDKRTMQVLFEKAAQSISPFTKVIKGKKEYSDAGFKDALIFETLVEHTNNGMGILVTTDTDYKGYKGAFKYVQVDNFRCIETVKDLKTILIENYHITDTRYLEAQIQGNEYLFERVLEEAGMDMQCNYAYEGVEEIQETDMGQEFILKLRVNGIIQSFEVVYDIGANELVSAGLKED